MKVGSIIQVKSFVDYVVKTPQDAEDGYLSASEIPAGTFVLIDTGKGSVAGIVTGVLHNVREDLLPYVGDEKRDVFLPYLSDMRSSYLEIKGIGNLSGGKVSQEVIFAPCINDAARAMTVEEIRSFHKPGVKYFKSIRKDAAATANAMGILIMAMPESAAVLKALKRYAEKSA